MRRRLRKLNQWYNLLLVKGGIFVLTARVNNYHQAYIATSDHVVKNRKASANEQQQNQFYWMDLFIVSAIGFIIASVGSFWSMFGSVFFLVACLIFLIPFLRKA
ncbi:MAG: hypothetical protein CM1200mP15_20970 [Dehalococcoidia bacterium]|nr:MAG: hypothetical protein CM1200mP15_20970 [Dehalococcoidia bacterium]